MTHMSPHAVAWRWTTERPLEHVLNRVGVHTKKRTGVAGGVDDNDTYYRHRSGNSTVVLVPCCGVRRPPGRNGNCLTRHWISDFFGMTALEKPTKPTACSLDNSRLLDQSHTTTPTHPRSSDTQKMITASMVAIQCTQSL